MIIECLLDAIKDTAVSIPFLFAAYLLMEALERHSEVLAGKLFRNSRHFGPLLGSAMGLVPQCGFSAAMSNFYVGGVIKIGTLISVFLATSDEAVLIMISHPDAVSKIGKLLLTKFIIGIFFGYLINLIFGRNERTKDIGDICQDEDCGCEDSEGILKPALIHTGKILGWIFGICFILNILVSLIGSDKLAVMLGGDILFQPFITALLGLIPNCAVSVLFTELYISGGLGFGSAVAGLSSGAGLGLIVLFRMNKDKKDCLKIVALLYLSAALSGLVLRLMGM